MASPVVVTPAPRPSGMAEERTGRFAFLVAAGIFASRVAGLVRQSFFAHYFGASAAGDAFQAAFRIPNLLQNLFGEGVLSASFIPEYANLNARGEHDEAREVAGAVFVALVLFTSVIVLLGIVFAPVLVEVLAPGFTAATKVQLTTVLVQILFPGAALLVFSAWCLGVLNSHRRFFLSYSAPIAWNVVMIGALVLLGAHRTPAQLAVALAWASVIGSGAQFLIQLPTVFRVAGRLRPHLHFRRPSTRRVFKNFGPAMVSRGVVQISAFIDMTLASYLPGGAIVSMAYAQTLYLLPGSLFGMSVSAAELPAMSSVVGSDSDVALALRERLQRGMERIAYFVVPSACAFLVLGDVMVSALFQSGRFSHADTLWVWEILGGSTLGLLASTLGRLDVSTYYALRDTKTPLKFAVARIALTTVLGVVFAFVVPPAFGLDPRWGAAGLTASAGLAGWIEFALLRRGLTKRIGRTGLRLAYVGTLWLAAIGAAVLGSAWRFVAFAHERYVLAVLALGTFGLAYLLFTVWLDVPAATAFAADLRRRLRV